MLILWDDEKSIMNVTWNISDVEITLIFVFIVGKSGNFHPGTPASIVP